MKILAILSEMKEIKLEIFSYKLKEIPSGNIPFIELFIESINERECTLVIIV